jgi:hypothetical protein
MSERQPSRASHHLTLIGSITLLCCSDRDATDPTRMTQNSHMSLPKVLTLLH